MRVVERAEAIRRIDALLDEAAGARLSYLQRFQLARLREMVLASDRPHVVRSLVWTCEFIATQGD